MQGTLRRIRHCPASAPAPAPARTSTPASLPISVCKSQPRIRTALVSPSSTLSLSTNRSPLSRAVSQEAVRNTWSSTASTRFPGPEPRGTDKDGRSGQDRAQREVLPSALTHQGYHAITRESIKQIVVKRGPGEVTTWESIIIAMRHRLGDEGVWDTFLEMQRRGLLQMFSRTRTPLIRDHVLAAALSNANRMAVLYAFAQRLRTQEDFHWPNLYAKVVNFYLEQADYDTAFLWHIRLMPTFPPSTETFGALLSSFAVDPTPRLQSTLNAMYVFSGYRKLYDHLVPALFDSGQSKVARSWRKKLIAYGDLPVSSRSQSFIQFLARYYPRLPLVKEEIDISGVAETTARDLEAHNWIAFRTPEPTGVYSDTFTAQWFATSWTSAEFAINLVHKLGLRILGPKALQSLALREEDAQGVSDRISQIENLGITIKPRMYSKALAFFAKQREEELLADLLRCDIHPDEFEDMDSRERLMEAAVTQQDWRRERLLQGIECAVEDRHSSGRLNQLLKQTLSKDHGFGKARLVLDRMETLQVSMAQNNSITLLERAFHDLGWHPVTRKEYFHGYRENPVLDRAINITRRVACHDVAIPVKYWKMLLYNLGRLGRFNELEQLCFEITQLYSSSRGGLIPVHPNDLPSSSQQERLQAPKDKSTSNGGQNSKFSSTCGPTEGDEESHHGPYSEAFWRAEMGAKYEKPKARHQQTKQEEPSHSHYPEEFWKAEIGEKPRGDDGPRATKAPDSEVSPKPQMIEKEYIPADLPFSHREHPVQKIFDTKLQRAIIRWGFDQSLGSEPVKASHAQMRETGLADFDVACGVFLLATLRDEGVLIDKQVVRSAVLSRLGVAQVPGRMRSRGRDKEELSARNIKTLVDRAWGSEVMPPVTQLLCELEKQKPKIWTRYSRSFQKAYDDEEDYDEFEVIGQEPEQVHRRLQDKSYRPIPSSI